MNLTDLVLELFRDLANNGFRTSKVLRHGENISPQAFPEIVLEIDKLLR